MNPAITQFDIIQATTTIKKKYLMLIYEITILNSFNKLYYDCKYLIR